MPPFHSTRNCRLITLKRLSSLTYESKLKTSYLLLQASSSSSRQTFDLSHHYFLAHRHKYKSENVRITIDLKLAKPPSEKVNSETDLLDCEDPSRMLLQLECPGPFQNCAEGTVSVSRFDFGISN